MLTGLTKSTDHPSSTIHLRFTSRNDMGTSHRPKQPHYISPRSPINEPVSKCPSSFQVSDAIHNIHGRSDTPCSQEQLLGYDPVGSS